MLVMPRYQFGKIRRSKSRTSTSCYSGSRTHSQPGVSSCCTMWYLTKRPDVARIPKQLTAEVAGPGLVTLPVRDQRHGRAVVAGQPYRDGAVVVEHDRGDFLARIISVPSSVAPTGLIN
jgi:hypothetical protein